MGWAERRNCRQRLERKERALTGEECARIAANIREGLQAICPRVDVSGDLGEMLRIADAFSGCRGDVFDHIKQTEGQEREWLLRGFLRMQQAREIASAFWHLPYVKNSGSVSQWVNKRLDRLLTQEHPAQDRLFEVIMAGRLVRSGRLDVWLGDAERGEPDIYVGVDGEKGRALECKRPRSVGSIDSAIRKARRQLREGAARTGILGTVIIDLESIFHRSGEADRPTVFYFFENREEAVKEAEERARLAVDAARLQLTKALDEGVRGILFCGLFTWMSRRPSAYSFQWIRRAEGHDDARVFDSILFE